MKMTNYIKDNLFHVLTAILMIVFVQMGLVSGAEASMGMMGMAVLQTAPFPIQAELTAVSIAYHNEKYIADMVLPRVPVGTQEFKYLTYDKGDRFTIPDTKVGRKSQPNQVEFGATEQTSSTEDYGLDDAVPQADINNAPPNFDPLGNAVEGVTDLVELDREKRVSDIVFAAGTYPAGNKVQLAGNAQWSDFANSDPMEDVEAAMDAPIFRPNTMVISRLAFSVLRRHPDIMKAVHGNSGDKGRARREAIQELFELDELLIGDAWHNTSKKGQSLAMTRLWGKHVALLHLNKQANTRKGTTFGMTGQFGGRVAGSIHDPDIGLRGGERVRAGESVKELITASDLGYFIEDAVA